MDIENLLRLLNEHRVRYVIIGATAFAVHGYARATLDVDIFIQADRDNAAAVREALRAFGYDMSEVTVEDLLKCKVLIRQYVMETDIHPFVAGINFEDVWQHRVEGKIGTACTHFASLDDLIKMKRAAGRPKYQEDLQVLLKLKATKKEGN